MHQSKIKILLCVQFQGRRDFSREDRGYSLLRTVYVTPLSVAVKDYKPYIGVMIIVAIWECGHFVLPLLRDKRHAFL
jgi:hypothetical protein